MKFKLGDRVVELEWPFKTGKVIEVAESDTFETGEFYMIRYENGDVMATGGEDIKVIESTPEPSDSL